MRECDNNKIHISSSFLLSICLVSGIFSKTLSTLKTCNTACVLLDCRDVIYVTV